MGFTMLLSCFLVMFSSVNVVSGLMLSTDREHSFTILSGTRTVQFTCPATSTAPPVTFRWFFKRFPSDVQVELLSNAHHTITDNTMIIDQLKKADKGIYLIEATDAVGQTQSCNVSLQVAYPPTFTSSLPPSRTATDKTRTSISCPVMGNPEPTITWLKDGVALAPGPSFELNGTEIIFIAANRLDEGSYQCNATNHYGSVISTPVKLIVIEEVVFTSAPKSLVYHNAGDTAVFTCNATGYPAPRLAWHKTFFPEDPVIFYENSTRPLVTYFAGPDSAYTELTYPSLQFEDHGLYECRADQLTHSQSTMFELVISASPMITSHHPAEVTVLLGDPYTFECNASGSPIPDITWYKNGLEVMASSDRHQLTRGVFQIIRSEGSDSGSYSCHASNSVGQVDSNVTNFFVKGLYFTQQPPATVLLNAGESTILKCEAAGSKYSLETTWYKNSVKIEKPCRVPGSEACRIYTNGSDLHLDKITGKDVGNYSCQIKEIGVVLEPHVLITKTVVDILEAPTFDSLLPTTMVGNYSGNLEMYCQASGVPQPTIRWFKDGFELGSDYHRLVNGSHLVFVNLVAADRGIYICVAENQAGEIRQQTNLTIISPPIANLTVIGGYSYAIVKWDIVDDGGSPATSLEMELREVAPRLTRWVSISINVTSPQGQYILQGLDYNATYELNIWAENNIGSGNAIKMKFETHDPVGTYDNDPYVHHKNKTMTQAGGGEFGMLLTIVVIAAIVIVSILVVICMVTRYRRINYGNADDNQTLVNNLHESVSSHANPVYNMETNGAASNSNGLELHDIKLSEDKSAK